MVETATTEVKRTTGSGASPVRLLGNGPRRWRWLGFGVALMAAGGLIAATAADQLDDRQGVLVASGDLPAGHVVTVADLKITELAGTKGLSVVRDDQVDEVVGHTLTVPVAEGSVLSHSALGADAAYPVVGQAIVGASLQPGRFPTSLRPGARVSVVVIGAETEGDSESAGPRAYAAHLQSFDPGTAGSAALVELVVDAGDAAQVASAAAAEKITVVQVSPQDGGR